MSSKFKTPLLIIIGVLLIAVIAYFGLSYYRNFQIQKEKKNQQTSEVEKLKEEVEN